MKKFILALILCLVTYSVQAETVKFITGKPPAAGTSTISYRSYAYGEVTTGTTVTVNKPTGTVDGDLMIAVVSTDTNTSFTLEGWTVIQEITVSTHNQTVLYKEASSEGASYAFSTGTGGDHAGIIMTFSKSGGTWDVEASSENSASSTSVTSTSITCTNNSVMVIGFGSDDTGSVSSAPADMTEVYKGAFPSDAVSAQVGAWYEARSSGAVTKSITTDSGDLTIIAVCIDLVP